MMKLIATILFLSGASAKATNYYVDASRPDDTGNGLTIEAAWKTIAKVNASSFVAGDSILFKRGEVWNETLRPPNSGSAGNYIIYGAYGSGVKPEFNAFEDVTMSSIGGNLYTGTITNGAAYQNTVLVNGSIAKKGRYPNSTYLISNNAGNNYYRIITSGLGGDYTGGELVTLPVYHWIIDNNRILSQSGDTLNLVSNRTYDVAYNLYFIQNLPSLCDVQNDYAYDSVSKVITVFSPSGLPTVQASVIDTLIVVDNKNYITFDGLTLDGANSVGIMKDSTVGITINNSTIKNTGGVNPFPITLSGLGGAAIRGRHTDLDIITNDSIINSLNNALMHIHNTTTSKRIVTNNYIKNTGIFPGMGNTGNGSYYAVTEGAGDSCQYSYNRIDSMGYMGINFSSSNSMVYHNYITKYCLWKSDGSAIGSSVLDGGNVHGSIIRSNITKDGVNDPYHFISAGIYLDGTYDVLCDSNTIINADYYAVLLGSTNKITFRDNLVDDSVGRNFQTLNSTAAGVAGFSYYMSNIFYQRSATAAWTCLDFAYSSSPQSRIVEDSNYFLRPINSEVNKIRNSFDNSFYSSVAAWSAVFGFDTHGHDTPTGITFEPAVTYINPTEQDSTINFTGQRKTDAKGIVYDNSIVLGSFRSAILFQSTTQPIPPVNPPSKIWNKTFKLFQQ